VVHIIIIIIIIIIGNKRKLSVAIATIGDPDLLFLDDEVQYSTVQFSKLTN